MKRVFALLLAAAMTLSLCACGGGDTTIRDDEENIAKKDPVAAQYLQELAVKLAEYPELPAMPSTEELDKALQDFGPDPEVIEAERQRVTGAEYAGKHGHGNAFPEIARGLAARVAAVFLEQCGLSGYHYTQNTDSRTGQNHRTFDAAEHDRCKNQRRNDGAEGDLHAVVDRIRQ